MASTPRRSSGSTRAAQPRSSATRATQATSKPAQPEQAEREPGAISGNLTFDPELRFTASGRPVCNVQVAVNDRVQNDTGEWEDTEPEFHRVTVWGQMGENVAESFQRGDRIVVIGYWQEREWEDKEGEKHSSTELTATDIGPSVKWNAARIQRARRSRS